MTKTLSGLLLLFLIFTSLTGCGDEKPLSDQYNDNSQSVPDIKTAERNGISSGNTQQISPENTIEITGTVVYKDIEGGFYAIDADDGSKYDPINLPDQFKKDGQKVKVTAEIKTGMMSFHMYGTIIKILGIAEQ